MASPAEAVPDDPLKEVFLRLPTAADLARASAACTTFRRVITDHSFLHRFRAAHPPPLLGITGIPFVPAEPPHPSAAAARAFADFADASADFRHSFLPYPDRWVLRDFRDGRTLLLAVPEGSGFRPHQCSPRALYRELAVCDPVHRRHLLLPLIPEDQAALVSDPVAFYPLLAPAGEDEEPTSFRVICLAICAKKMVVFMFQPSCGSWHTVTFDGRENSTMGTSTSPGLELEALSYHYYAHGCFCWVKGPRDKKLVVFDTRTMELSCVDVPPSPNWLGWPDYAVVEAEEGKLGMFARYSSIGRAREYIQYAILRTDAGDASKWQVESTIPLPVNRRYSIMGVAGGYMLLHGYAIDNAASSSIVFSLNLKTLLLERFCETINAAFMHPSLYAGFPPPLSPPRI